MELKLFLAVLRRRVLIILLCTVLAGLAGFLFTRTQPPVYESAARVIVGAALDDPQVDSNALRVSALVGLTYEAITTSRPIMEQVISDLNLSVSPEVLARDVSALWADKTQLLTIRVRAAAPEQAAYIANGVVEALIANSPSGTGGTDPNRQQAAAAEVATIGQQIDLLEQEITDLLDQIRASEDSVAQRSLEIQLTQRRNELSQAERDLLTQQAIVTQINPNRLKLFEAAVPIARPVEPDVTRTVLASLLGGAILGLIIAFLLEYLIRVVDTPDQLRRLSGLPYVGGIVRRRANNQGALDSRSIEGYRTVRNNVTALLGEDQPLALLVTSPTSGEGKTEIAVGLAQVFAQTGRRVLLIDANFHHPRIAERFNLSKASGLVGLLRNPGSAPEPVTVWNTADLAVITAGTVSANSPDQLTPRRTREIIATCRELADVVIVDGPSAEYADLLVLALAVDGVLLVAAKGKTKQDRLSGVVARLRQIEAPMIGAVLNLASAGETLAVAAYPGAQSGPVVLPAADLRSKP